MLVWWLASRLEEREPEKATHLLFSIAEVVAKTHSFLPDPDL